MVKLNGHAISIEVSGPEAGPVVVLLHHGLGSTRAWKKQIPALVQAGYRVVAYDRWGYGSSEDRPQLDIPLFETDVADLQAVLDYLEARPVCLVGHSDGGTVALLYAARFPERVRCLVTIAAHIYVEPKMQDEIHAIRRRYEAEPHMRAGLQRQHGEKVDTVFWNWYRAWTDEPERMQAWDLRPRLAQIRCPALVVQGEGDEHATLAHVQDIAAAIPEAELWILPGAGHMLPQDAAEAFNQKLLAFLRREGK